MSLHARSAGRSLVTLLVIVLVVGALAWIYNERFRSEVEQRLEELSSWSEEAIAEDPVRYLDFVERRTEETLAELPSFDATEFNLE